MADSIAIPGDYAPLLAEIKARVRRAQTRAVLAVNAELIRLDWESGGMICQRQQQEGWGAAVIIRLARDLHNELPEEKGFSERNIKRMLAFYREYPQANFVPQAAAQFPYALRGIDKPIGVSTYELTRALPAELQTSLPSIEAIEQALADQAVDMSP